MTAALAVTAAGASLGASPPGAAAAAAPAASTHACCPQVGYTCYMNLDGVVISVPDVRPC